jgi:hypothetical protein
MLVLLLAALPHHADAQRFGFRGGGGSSRRDPSALWGMPDGRIGFTFCRLMYEAVIEQPVSGTGWGIEYPRADQNFPTRLAQLTNTPISYWWSAPRARIDTWDGMPGHTVVEANDPNLFQCPIVFFASAGTAGWSAEEVVKLREYLLKGGFMWGDDFWGEYTWEHLREQMTGENGILPGYPIVRLMPGDPVFQTFYSIKEMPQIPSLNNFGRLGGSTSELGAESATPEMWAIMDGDRPMVLMTHNTDIADGWEREADMEAFFQRFAWQAYSVGINVMMWIMTR